MKPIISKTIWENFFAVRPCHEGRAVAEQTKAANEQHYEVPTELYLLCLGRNLKYSCCLYDEPGLTLDEAEIKMVRDTLYPPSQHQCRGASNTYMVYKFNTWRGKC